MSSNLARFRRKSHAPATPRGTTPGAWHAAGETYALVTLNYKSVAKLGAGPLIIVGTLQALYAIYPTLLNLLLAVCGNLAATGVFAVGLQRMVARSVQHQLYRFRFTSRPWRILSAVMLAMIPVVFLSLGILGLGYVLSQMITQPSLISALLLAGVVMGLALAAYTAVRFSVIMPAIALDEPIDLHSAVRATRGRAGQLLRGLLATLSPVLVAAVALSFYAVKSGAGAWAASSLQGFTVITAVPLSVVFLTLSYFRYVRGAASPKMKVIGEPEWYVRAWYLLQHGANFGVKMIGLVSAQVLQMLRSKPKPKQKSKFEATVRRAPNFTAQHATPVSSMPSMRPAATQTVAPPAAKADLARKVAEKLVDLEEDKLAQLAALLDKNVAPKGSPQPPKMNPRSQAKPPVVKPAGAPAQPAPLRRARAGAERAAGAKALSDMVASNENAAPQKPTQKNS